MPASGLCLLPARELAARIRRKEISARELVQAHLARIEEANPKVNAVVTLTAGQALEDARRADEAQARGEPLGALHGLPVVHKDLFLTRGVRTTYGSPIYKDFVPDEDTLIVARLKAAGAISLGKSNTPEFGAGSQTYNEIFGETLNPYDLTKTCGGSSGGAAVALACGMVPLADGSDFGGSLRNPASFCNVVGMRPSPGRVPCYPEDLGWFELTIHGPMARTVGDLALMLSSIAGPDPRSPLSLPEPGGLFHRPLERDFYGVRAAWCPDLGGLPLDRRVREALEKQRRVFENLGMIVEEAALNLAGADEVFKTLRAWRFAARFGDLLKTHRRQMKETVIWNIEEGLKLTGTRVAEAEKNRTRLYRRTKAFMEKYEFILCAVSQVPPFDVKERFVTEIEGVKMESYIDWMKSAYWISATGLPAVSLPAGFTPEGLPVGLQICGRHRDDAGVLQLAHGFERETLFWKQAPSLGSPSK